LTSPGWEVMFPRTWGNVPDRRQEQPVASRPVDIHVPNLTAQRAVVTGGSDGIGLRIATRLAAAGAEVLLPVRNPAKGEAAIATIKKVAPSATVSTRVADLSSLESVAGLGEALRQEGAPIH